MRSGKDAKENEISEKTTIIPETEGAEILHSGKDGDLDWSIDSKGVLKISGEGNYKSYSQGYPDWYKFGDEILRAEINVTGITQTEFMFWDCNNLTSLD